MTSPKKDKFSPLMAEFIGDTFWLIAVILSAVYISPYALMLFLLSVPYLRYLDRY